MINPRFLLIVLTVVAGCLSAREPRALSLLEAAEMAIEDGFHDLAHTRIAKAEALAGTPAQKVDAALLRAKSHLLEGEWGPAAKALDDIQAQAAAAGRAEAHAFWRALVERTAGGKETFPDILKRLEGLEAGEPLGTPIRRLRARCLVDAGKTEEALKELEAADSSAAWLDAAAVAFQGGFTNRASNALLRLQKNDATHLDVRRGAVWLAALHRQQQHPAAAHGALDKVLAQADLPADLKRLAQLERVALHSVTNVVEAAKILGELGATEPTLEMRAVYAVRQGRMLMGSRADERERQGASLILKSIPDLADDAERSETLLSLAERQFQAGRYKEAEAAYDSHLQAFTNQTGRVLALRGKAWAVFEQERFAEAVGLFNKVFKEGEANPVKEEALFKVADAYFAAGEYEKAAEQYRRFARLVYDESRRPQVIFQTGLALVRAGRHVEGRREFSHLVRLYGESEYTEKAMIELAALDQQDMNWVEAIDRYGEYLTTYTNGRFRVEAELSRSFCAYRLGDFEWALEGFDNILKNHPEHELAQRAAHMRGWAIFLRGDEPAAREVFEAFLAKYPDAPQQEDTLFWLAERDYNADKMMEAEERFLAIATRFPEGRLCDQAYFWAGRAAANQKEFTRAREHYTAMIKARPDSPRVPEALFGQGEALLIQGKFTDAIHVFKQLVDEHPTSNLVPATWNRIGDSQRAQSGDGPDRYADAITSYQTALNAKTASDALKVEVGCRLGSLYQNLGQSKLAIQHFTEAAYLYLEQRKRLGPELEARFTQSAYAAAKLLEQDRQFDKAERLYRRIVEQGGGEAKEAEKRIQKIMLERLIPFGGN